MLNEDCETDNEDNRNKVQLLKTHSVVTECPSVSTIVSLSDGLYQMNNKYSTETNNSSTTTKPIRCKTIVYKDKAQKKSSTSFIYKKSQSQLINKTPLKGFCIHKQLTFNPNSTSIIVSSENETNFTSNDFNVLSNYEELLSTVLNYIRYNSLSFNHCIRLWDLEVKENHVKVIERYLPKSNAIVSLKQLHNLTLISIMLCFAFRSKLIKSNAKEKLIELIDLHKEAFILNLRQISEKSTTHHLSNQSIGLLNKLINKMEANLRDKTRICCSNDYEERKNDYVLLLIKYCSIITNFQQQIIFCYSGENKQVHDCNPIISNLSDVINNSASYSIDNIDKVFKQNILLKLNIENENDYIHNQIFDLSHELEINLNLNQEIKSVRTPYLNKQCLKEYTLILDLSNILVNYTKRNNNNNKGLIKLRPGLHEFLNQCCMFYELIAFTAYDKEEADFIIDEIEQNHIYFDYRLYKEHTHFLNNVYVKDLNDLGRDLSRIIIIDHLPQCYSLQKENGIFIKAFRGDDTKDCALLDLITILKTIAMKEMDVRDGIVLFHKDITTKISSNYHRSQMN